MLEALLQFALKLMPKPIKKFWEKYESALRYCYYGFWTTVVSYVTKVLGKWLFALGGHDIKETVPNILNTTISWAIAATFAFVVNKKYVFKSKTDTGKELFHELSTFYGARAVSFFLEVFIMWLTTSHWAWNYYLMSLLSQFIILVLNYVFSKVVVFRSGSAAKQSKTE